LHEEDDDAATEDAVTEPVFDDVVAAAAGPSGVGLLETDEVVVEAAVDDDVPLDVVEHLVDVVAVVAAACTVVWTAASLKSPPVTVDVPNVASPMSAAPPTSRVAATRRAPSVRVTLLRWLPGRGARLGARRDTLMHSAP
jgi:hypothetical protein